MRDYILQYNNVGLIFKGSKEIVTTSPVFDCRMSSDAHSPGNPCEYLHKFVLPESTAPELHFVADS